MSIIPFSNEIINTISQSVFDFLIPTQNKAVFDEHVVNEYTLGKSFEIMNQQVFGRYLEHLDAAFFTSTERKSNYTIKQKRSRQLMTIVGPLFFTRRQYQHKISKKFFYFIDTLLQIDPYQRLSNTLKFEVLKSVTQLSYQKTALRFGISKSGVWKLVRSFAGCSFSPPDFIGKREIPLLYVQADECYAALQTHTHADKKSNRIIVEQVLIHEGLIPTGTKNRNKLVNKTLFTRNLNESSHRFYKRINDWIQRNYAYDSLYFYGDGAAWIKKCARSIGATFILDLFHTKQAIHRITKDAEMRSVLSHCIHKNDYDLFVQTLITLQLSIRLATKSQIQSMKYIVSNWDHIQLNFSLPRSVGCSQEGINFHYFASRLTTFPKGWSLENLRTISGLITLVTNAHTFSHLQHLLLPSTNTLDSAITACPNTPEIKHYITIETLSENHQYYRQAISHIQSFKTS